jgi:hypothetical protein
MLRLGLYIFCCVAVLVLSFSGCGATIERTDSAPVVESREVALEKAQEPPWMTDPTCCQVTPAPVEMREAWRRFVQDGRYRLARLEDMKFGEAARRKLPLAEGKYLVTYEFPWGELGYNQTPGAEHLAALVVDNTQPEGSRLGLVIFSSPKDKGGAYVPHWLRSRLDLSRVTLHRASGELYVHERRDDGTEGVCNVGWDKGRKAYVCG